MKADVLRQAKFRFVKAASLRPQQGVPSRISAVLISQIPAVKNAECLSLDALQLFLSVNPLWVVPDGKNYRVVLTNGIAPYLNRLPPEIQVPVFVLPKPKKNELDAIYQLQLQASFLQKIINALDLSTASGSVLALWTAMGKGARKALSPELESKSGLARITGINRRKKPQTQTVINSQFRQEELLGEKSDERKAEH